MMDIPLLPLGGASTLAFAPSTAPTHHPWTPMFRPEQWVYADGSEMKGKPCVGAVGVHALVCTTVYIDVGDTDEARTIMRAYLVAICTALDKVAAHKCVKIFTNSLSSLKLIWHRYTNPGTRGPQHYYHHMILLSGITDFLEDRRRQRLSITLDKIHAHTNIRVNDLTDAAAKLVITQYDSLPESQKLKATVGEVAPRPPY